MYTCYFRKCTQSNIILVHHLENTGIQNQDVLVNWCHKSHQNGKQIIAIKKSSSQNHSWLGQSLFPFVSFILNSKGKSIPSAKLTLALVWNTSLPQVTNLQRFPASTSTAPLVGPPNNRRFIKTTVQKDDKSWKLHKIQIFSIYLLHFFFRFSLNFPNGKTKSGSIIRR